MHKPSLAGLLIIAASAASHADNCDSIRDQIESRYRAGGTVNFTVKVVDASAVASARIVGSCGNGTRRIIFMQGESPSGTPASPSRAATPAEQPILTECKDGSISHTGNCRK